MEKLNPRDSLLSDMDYSAIVDTTRDTLDLTLQRVSLNESVNIDTTMDQQ